MIKVLNVTKKYGDFVALDCISIDLPNKGLVALTGENGCGKTTFLNILSTIDTPDCGSVTFNGLLYCPMNYNRLRNNVISFIQQDSIFAGWLSVQDNFELAGDPVEQCVNLLKKYNILEKGAVKPSVLSGGQRQKCSFIRGAGTDTSILLVDEPTSNMDAKSEEETFRLLKKMSENRLVVVVSHNRALIGTFADLTVYMDKGKVVEVCDNRSSGGMIVEGDTVKIPSDDHYSLVEDWNNLRKLLSKKNEVRLSLYDSMEDYIEPLDYTVSPSALHPKEKRRNSVVRKASLKSISSRPFPLIISVLFTAVLLLLSSFSLCLCSVDRLQFEYNTIVANGYSPIAFVNDNPIEFVPGEGWVETVNRLSMSDYKSFIETQKITGLAMNTGYFQSWDIGLSGESHFMDWRISGSAFIDCDYASNIDIAYGKLPAVDEAMICDYIADQLIEEGIRGSYQEIIEKGIIINTCPVKISGIIKTNYDAIPLVSKWHKYIRYSEDEYYHANYYSENYLCRLFLNQKEYETKPENGVSLIEFNSGFFAKLVIVEDGKFDGKNAFANRYIFDNCPDFLSSGAYSSFSMSPFSTESVDDGLDYPVVYIERSVSHDSYYDFGALGCMDFDTLYFPVSNIQQYRAIRTELKLKHSTPLSNKLQGIDGAIKVLRVGIAVILALFIMLTTGFAFWTWCDSSRKVSYALYTLIVKGYSNAQVFLFEGIRLGIRLAGELILSTGIYLGTVPIINEQIEKAFGFKMTLLPSNPLFAFEAFALYAVIMIITVSIRTFLMTRRNPIKLYNKALKNT